MLIDSNPLPEIDVVMPLISKDLDVALFSINSLRDKSQNPIRKIFIVSPNDPVIISFCEKNNLIFVLEDEILPTTKDSLKKIIKNKEKLGWFIQQLIKLNSDKIDDLLEDYLVFDADTILLQPQFFLAENYTIMKFSDEYHLLYKLTNKAILGSFHSSLVSFISHHMVFNQSRLSSLKRSINEIHKGKKWFEVILGEATKRNYFFSEYELYSQYVLTKYKSCYEVQYWFNLNSKHDSFESIVFPKGGFYQSVSYHNYKRIV